MVLEISISYLSYSLKIMSRNTFPEPQPDSASYIYFLLRVFFCLKVLSEDRSPPFELEEGSKARVVVLWLVGLAEE